MDIEKEAIHTQTEIRLLEEKKTLLQSSLQSNADLKDELKKLDTRFEQVRSRFIEAVVQLAVHYQLNPLEWEAQKPTTSAQLVKNIEAIMHALPPPPLPKTPAEIFFAAGVEHSLTQQAMEITKGKPK